MGEIALVLLASLPGPAKLTAASLSCDPLTDVRRTVFDLHVRFALSEKDDRLSVHQGEVLQVQHDSAAVRFCVEQLFQFGYTFRVHSAAQPKDRLSVRCSCDP